MPSKYSSRFKYKKCHTNYSLHLKFPFFSISNRFVCYFLFHFLFCFVHVFIFFSFFPPHPVLTSSINTSPPPNDIKKPKRKRKYLGTFQSRLESFNFVSNFCLSSHLCDTYLRAKKINICSKTNIFSLLVIETAFWTWDISRWDTTGIKNLTSYHF